MRNGVAQAPVKSAVVLLSGGLDSATTLAIATASGFSCHALSFSYGQRHIVELACATKVARSLKATSHRVVSLDTSVFEASALTGHGPIPRHRGYDEMAREIPDTYVPARNTVFLSYALALGETLGSADIFIGATAIDYSGYPDCRPEYLAAFEEMANLATRASAAGEIHISVHAPLVALAKHEIISQGLALGVDYSLTHSCYDPSATGAPCGSCDSCLLRAQGFATLGMKDPALV